MIKKITSILTSPLGYKYKCVFIFNYIGSLDNKINGTFYIGDPKTTVDEACVTISVFFPAKDSFVDSSIASLILVKYYEKCSEGKALQQGEGTVDMINTSMSFVKQTCTFIKEFKLNDASTKKCDDGSVISLPYFYITQKSMTWYEGRFGAYLKEPFYTNYKNTVELIMNNTLPTFNIFVANHIGNKLSISVINEIKNVYNEGDTLHTFFTKLYSKYDKALTCILLQPWIDTFMSNVGLQKYITQSDWFISVSNIPVYKFALNKSTYRVNTFNNSRKRQPWNTH